MKTIKYLPAVFLAGSFLIMPFAGFAADQKPSAKPYKLDKCLVTDEKLGSMGAPFVMEHQGQEIKFCCKSCKKDFDKDTAKFMKKLADEEKKAEAAKPKTEK